MKKLLIVAILFILTSKMNANSQNVLQLGGGNVVYIENLDYYKIAHNSYQKISVDSLVKLSNTLPNLSVRYDKDNEKLTIIMEESLTILNVVEDIKIFYNPQSEIIKINTDKKCWIDLRNNFPSVFRD